MFNTWERYFYRELLKSFALFLMLFYVLYIVVDYASHLSGAHYHHSRLHIGEFLLHYLCEFSVRAEILVPFGLLIATVHTLCRYNVNTELVALLAGGYSLHRLMRPYLVVGLLGVAALYINNEFFLPHAAKKLSSLDEKYASQKNKQLQSISARHLHLSDGSLLLYRDFDSSSQQFNNAIWIPETGEIWKMRTLDPFLTVPVGTFVDHFKRGANGSMDYIESSAKFAFEKMSFNRQKLSETIAPAEELAISTLIKATPELSASDENEKAARSLTALFRKLALPWLALIAIIGPAPFCIRFSRNQSIFLIFTGAIFGLVAIYLVIDSTTVLGERQLISPAMAIFAPFSFFISLFLYRYARMRT